MNPWGILIAGIGLVLIVLGVKGTYGNAISTITGRQYQQPQSTSTASSAPNIQLTSKQTPAQPKTNPGQGTRPVD